MSNETDADKELKVNKWDLNATKNAIDDAVKLVCHFDLVNVVMLFLEFYDGT
jgi:hypothetical protein